MEKQKQTSPTKHHDTVLVKRDSSKLEAGGQVQPSLGSRLFWFVLLWAGGVVAIAIFSYSLRALIL